MSLNNLSSTCVQSGFLNYMVNKDSRERHLYLYQPHRLGGERETHLVFYSMDFYISINDIMGVLVDFNELSVFTMYLYVTSSMGRIKRQWVPATEEVIALANHCDLLESLGYLLFVGHRSEVYVNSASNVIIFCHLQQPLSPLPTVE